MVEGPYSARFHHIDRGEIPTVPGRPVGVVARWSSTVSSIYVSTEFVVVECGVDGCDQVFAMSRRFYDETKRGTGWCCPRGHSRRWTGPSTEQKLEAAQARERHLADQLRAAEAEAEATRVKLLRDRHRFANGVCPCCNRTFSNVARHMQTQHPDFDPAGVGPPPQYECSCGRAFETQRGLAVHQGRNRPEDWTNTGRSKYSRHLTVV